MSAVENHLLSNETIQYKSRVHSIVFILPLIFFIIAVACYMGPFYLHTMAFLFFVIGISLFIMSLITYNFSEFAVTSKRVLIKRGLLTETVTELMLEKIETVQVRQDIFGRIFNYGDVDIIGIGSSNDRLLQIESPYEFRNAVLKAMG